jgi:hypothetical protein
MIDASILSRVAIKSIRNWMDRSLPNLGRKDAISGRWLFTLRDCMKLVVVHDLVVRTNGGFLSADAALIAELVVSRIDEVLKQSADHRPALNLLIGWREDGTMVATFHSIEQPGHYHPPRSNDREVYQPLRRAHMVIPVWERFADVVLRTEQLGRINRRAEAPVHV